MTQTEKQHRIIGLDVLRSLAIFLVVYEHSLILFPNSSHYNFLKIHLDGVSLFFVLSGFLISSILYTNFQKDGLNFKTIFKFWINRWFKTIPPYFLILGLILLYFLITKQNYDAFNFSYLIFSQSLFKLHPDFFKEAWSLNIEEWFYFLFPIFIWVANYFSKNRKTSILISILLFLIIPFVSSVYFYESHHGIIDFREDLRKITLFRLDSIMYGVLAFFLSLKFQKIWNTKPKLFLFLSLIILLFFELNFRFRLVNIYQPFIFPMESIAIAFSLPFLNNLKRFKSDLLNMMFIFFSKISYSMYLVNLTLIQIILLPICQKYLLSSFENKYVPYVTFWILTLILASLLYYFFEKPILKFRDLKFKR